MGIRVPRTLRLLPGLFGVVLALKALGLDFEVTAMPRLGLQGLFLLVLAVAAIVLLFMKGLAALYQGHGKALEVDVGSDVYREGNNQGVSLLEIRFNSKSVKDSALLKILSLARIRGVKAASRYTLILTLNKGVERLFVSIEGSETEKDLFKALVSSISEDLRIIEASGDNGPSTALFQEKGFHPRSPANDETLAGTDSFKGLGVTRGKDDLSSPRLYVGKTLYPEEGAYLFLDKRDLAGHVGVFGSTGTGKSTTLFTIACRAWSDMGLATILLDWTGEHSEYIAGTLGNHPGEFKLLDPVSGDAALNPLLLSRSSEGADVVVEILSKALDLSEPQSFMLRRVIEDSSPHTLGELEVYVEALPEESRWDREVKRALLRKVGVLTRGSAKRAFSASDPYLFQFQGSGTHFFHIVRLDNIRSLAARRAYSLTLLATMFFKAQERRIDGEFLVAIDEAHNVFTLNGSKMGLLELLVSESRKYGLYVALATQSPSLVPNPIILNTNTKIAHALRSYRDKTVIAETMSLPHDLQEMIDKLAVGTAVFQSVSLPEPVIVKVEKHRPVGDNIC